MDRTIDLAALRRRLEDHADLSNGELACVDRRDEQALQSAYLLRFETAMREAASALAGLASAQRYTDQKTLDLLQQLLPYGHDEAALLDVMKGLGEQAASGGQSDRAMQLLEQMATRAATIGQRTDRRSRAAMRYAFDSDVDALYTQVAAAFVAPRHLSPSDSLRVEFLVSGIVDDNSGTKVAAAIVEGLRERGHSVGIISTEHVRSEGSSAVTALRGTGVGVWLAPPTGHEGRVRAILERMNAKPADVVLYLTFPMDAVAKVAASVGLSRRQIFLNTSYEQRCGKFDAILETVSEEQVARSAQPDIARFVGTGLIAGRAIDAATAFSRADLGVADTSVLFGTCGRLQKCCERGFMTAAADILTGIADSVLLLVGPAYDQEASTLQQYFESRGVAARVKFLGPQSQNVPRILKALDVYLDTFPFPGAQSVLEAMWAGVPVVAMATVPDENLDPTGCGPTTAVAERFIGNAAPLAPAGDVRAYVKTAIAFARDSVLRSNVGNALAARARKHYDFATFIQRIDAVLREVAAR